MKRIISLAAMFLCCIAISFAQFSGSGSGTENDPYLILNPIHLSQMRNFQNQSGVYFKLMSNIDVSEFIEDEWPTQGWMPIGTSSTPFRGILDGNGKAISGFWINRPNTDYVGLFGYATGATIKDLTINATSVKGKAYVGIILGNSDLTKISGCLVTSNDVIGTGERVGGIVGSLWGGSLNTHTSVIPNISECRVTCNNITGVNFVGGVYGRAEDGNHIITTCQVQGNVNGGDYVGGIMGYGADKISNTNFCGNVNGGDYVGGIMGYGLGDCKISNTSYCGNVTGKNNVGGICGTIDWSCITGTINGCYAVSHVVATGNRVGGLIGSLGSSSLTNSYHCGSVTGKLYVGGLVGYAYTSGENYRDNEIVKCYTNSIVNGTKLVGGLVGLIEGRLFNPYTYSSRFRYSYLKSNIAICSSVKATEGDVGRIYGAIGKYVTIGEIGTADENKAWNRTIIVSAGVAQDVVDNEQNGAGVSATTLKLKATYVGMGWDFNDTWAIQETECYPYMKTQTAPPVITSKVVSGATTISGKCVDGGMVTLEIDGKKQEVASNGNNFSFTVSPLQAGHEVRISAKAEGKEPSYYTKETVSYLGKGTEDDPYQIYTAADLTGVYRKGYFKLMNDIDLTDYINQFSPTEGWESIGRDGSEAIHFDGDGHKITGLWCNSTRDNTGLFSCFANGSIKNLTVETGNGKQVKGGNNTGILIGKMMNGTIENCHVLGIVADGTPVGGMVGLFEGGEIVRCQANVSITTSLSTSYVGGLVGIINDGKIDDCVTTGKIIATGTESYVGGLVSKSSATITNCYSNAKVISSYNAAGLVAYNYGTVDKCYATGGLQSNNYAAGIIGYNDGENAVIRNCVAMNNKIEIVKESQQGGGYGQRIVGGIKNGAPTPEMNNYALKTMQVSVNNIAQKVYDDIMNGTSKTAEELKKQSTYVTLGWNFTETWSIEEEKNYPTLKNIGDISALFGTYKLIYVIDGNEYRIEEIEQGANVTPIDAPTKEGYTFKGWNGIPNTMPAHDVTVTGSFTINKYILSYKVDDVEYKTIEVEYGTSLTPIDEPTKTGYTFTGWVGLPETMPANDVTVIGSFSINSYKLTYILDGVEYKTATIEYGKTITPESVPTKEGYSFSGWTDLPETMPANDVTVTGSYTINKYKIIYMVDGVEYGISEIEYGAEVNPIGEPSKEGYTFSGWQNLPEEMPAHDVTVSGTFKVNSYKVTFMYGDNVLTTIEVNYGAAIELPTSLNSERYTLIEWKDVPDTMPAHDITIYADYVDGINTITADSKDEQYIRMNGMYAPDLKPGLNIIRMKDGTTKKVWVK